MRLLEDLKHWVIQHTGKIKPNNLIFMRFHGLSICHFLRVSVLPNNKLHMMRKCVIILFFFFLNGHTNGIRWNFPGLGWNQTTAVTYTVAVATPNPFTHCTGQWLNLHLCSNPSPCSGAGGFLTHCIALGTTPRPQFFFKTSASRAWYLRGYSGYTEQIFSSFTH